MLHEKLMSYMESKELAKDLSKDGARWPRGYGYLTDQMKRAMASVVLNQAEGNARRSRTERRRFFEIARASAAEVSACVDLGLPGAERSGTARGREIWDCPGQKDLGLPGAERSGTARGRKIQILQIEAPTGQQVIVGFDTVILFLDNRIISLSSLPLAISSPFIA